MPLRAILVVTGKVFSIVPYYIKDLKWKYQKLYGLLWLTLPWQRAIHDFPTKPLHLKQWCAMSCITIFSLHFANFMLDCSVKMVQKFTILLFMIFGSITNMPSRWEGTKKPYSFRDARSFTCPGMRGLTLALPVHGTSSYRKIGIAPSTLLKLGKETVYTTFKVFGITQPGI